MNAALLGSSLVAAGLSAGLGLMLSWPAEEQPLTLTRQDAAAAASAEIAWRTDLAAAMAEARRTKRPLLAVFR